MEFHEREYFISQIVLGVIRVRIGNDLFLTINPRTAEQEYDAQIVFKDAYEKAYFNGIMTSRETKEMMLEQGLWSKLHDKEFEQIEKRVEDLKIEVYRSGFNSNEQKKFRRQLRQTEVVLEQYHKKKHEYDSTSCEGLASYTRWCWTIENCTTKNGEKYNFGDISVAKLLSMYQDEIMSEKTLREISRTEPWRTSWSAAKKSSQPIFNNSSAASITKEQQSLILWSSMYDSIGESPDAPSDKVINDDDMIDGWLILQRREREQAKKQSVAEEMIGNERIANSDEVFIVAKSDEDLENISSLNDTRGQAIKQQREGYLVPGEQGPTKHQNLPDVARDIKMQQHREYVQALKNKQ